MGGHRRKNKVNPFAQKKRIRKENAEIKQQRAQEPYEEIVRENENFIKYYKLQNICPEGEWESFLKAIRSNLPVTFRVTGSRGESQALLDIIKHEFFDDYINGAKELQSDEQEFEKPFCLPWYPNELAWQLELTRKDIRRSESLFRLHNFLIAETSAGGISRQEAVSMIPPIVLDVKPHHKVLDMCAAPGSKTAQLIESLHATDEIPTGFVVANDLDNNRCYMLVHQAKRLNSPCFLVTNHDSTQLPNLRIGPNDEVLKFDRVLCDVPCSGDGTMRKNPDIWKKWNAAQALNLHGIQYRVAKRGAELLAVGGRLVYSTCSLNPIENEAVIYRLVKESEGALEIVDASELVPGLKYHKGMTNWRPADRDIEFYDKFEDVPERWITSIRPQMFADDPEDIKKHGIEKCIRILPHLQNTGAFFVVALVKKKLLPWEKDESLKTKLPANETSNTTETSDNVTKSEEKSVPWGPQRKKRRLHGYKEDPFVFFEPNDETWPTIKEYYQISDKFDSQCLLTRCLGGKKKNIYYCTEPIRQIVQKNEHAVKIINTGVKAFARCDNKNMKCAFRLAQEGLPTTNLFIGDSRRVLIERDDLIILLQNNDPMNPPSITSLSETTQGRIENLGPGSCILYYKDEKFSLTLVGWRGMQSLRAYIDTNETIHMLRLLRADISKFDKNKYKKVDETTEEAEVVNAEEIDETPEEDETNKDEKMDVTIEANA